MAAINDPGRSVPESGGRVVSPSVARTSGNAPTDRVIRMARGPEAEVIVPGQGVLVPGNPVRCDRRVRPATRE